MDRYSNNINIIQKIKNKLDIVDVVSNYVSLQKKGRDYWGCCPFHTEKTPSFQVKVDHQYYRCYGCNKKGDIFNFIMEIEKIPFGEALERLAQKAGVELPENTIDPEYAKKKKEVQKIYEINKETAKFYYNVLKTEQGEVALNYFANRGLTKETIMKFGMGYSPNFHSLIEYLTSLGYSISSMKSAGVIGINEKGNPYDFFAERVIIPIISANGKILGFTGRSLEKKPAFGKYKNTGTTLVFNKGKTLFGLNLYKQNVPPSNKALILVEGHMDVVSMFQAGIKNVVASMGTALTQEQCKEIKRYAEVVYVSFDGDSAGQDATLKGLTLLKNEGLEVKVVQLKDNLDPDDYVKLYGKEGYLKLIDESIPLIDYKLKVIEEKYKFNSYDERVKYAKEAIGILNELDELEKGIYIQKVSKISGLSQERINDATQNSVKNKVTNNNIKKEENKKIYNDANTLAERFVLASMIFSKNYVKLDEIEPIFFKTKEHQAICQYVISCYEEDKKPIASALYDLTTQLDANLIIEAVDEIKIENQALFYEQSMKKLTVSYVDEELKRIIAKLNNESDIESKEKLKRRVQELTKLKKR